MILSLSRPEFPEPRNSGHSDQNFFFISAFLSTDDKNLSQSIRGIELVLL